MPDALVRAIVAADQAAVCAALRGRSEAERGEASRIVVPAKAREGFGSFVRGADGGLEWRERTGYGDSHGEFLQSLALSLAALGTASLKDLRQIGAWSLAFVDPVPAAEILLERQATWTNAFVAWFLRAETWQSTWPHVRPLVQAGLAERPDDVTYLNGMIAAARREDSHAAALLARDPDLLRHELWELLAFDAGDDSLTAADAAGAGWGDAIKACAADGRIDRERLLDALLSALQSDLSAYRSTWHRRLWRDLKPTAAERAARADGLRALLGAAAAPVVAFAVEELARLKPLPAGLEHELAPALTAPAKKTVRTALKLLDRIESPDRAALATFALAHEAADIQGEVLDRLERWGADHDALARYVETLSATVRPRAERLLDGAAGGRGENASGRGETAGRRGETAGESGEARAARGGDDAAPADAASANHALDARVAAIPEPIRSALAFGGSVPQAPVPGEPVLGAPIAPIETLDELAVALGNALKERSGRRDERLVDAILRHCGEPMEGPPRAYADQLYPGWWIPGLAHAWLTRTAPPPPERTDLALIHQRLGAVTTRVANATAGRLLALPTHHGGWIEPHALVERLRDAGEDVDEPELMQALLRLAPHGRDPALADGLSGRPGALVRCALGGPMVEGDDAAAVAARTVRDPPLEPAPEARVDVRLDPWAEFQTHITAPPPLAELYTRLRRDDLVEPLLWPGRRDLTCAMAIRRAAWAIEYSVWGSDIPQLLELLLHPREPLTPLAIRLLTVALCAQEPAVHMLAADVVIAAIEDGRLDAAGLAAPLTQDLPTGILPTNRLGARLATIAKAGPLHAAVIRDLLDAIVPALEPLATRAYTPLLEPFAELCAQTNTGPGASRTFLDTITGSSKAAKAAKSLLARDGEPPPHEATLALEARVRRAERWLSAR